MFLKSLLPFLLISLVVFTHCFCQCETVSFSINSAINPISCINQSLEISNTSSTALEYTWDFCEGDLSNTPTAQSVKQILAAVGLTGVDMVEDNGNFFLFLTGRTGNNVVRLDFGSNPENSNPAITNLGNISNVLNGPIGIKVVKEQNDWYALSYNSGTDQIIRIAFGSSLANNNPTASSVIKAYASNNTNASIEIGISENKSVAIVTNPATNKLTLINFGSSITNSPVDPADLIITTAVPGASSLRGITLVRDCKQWYGFAVAATNKKLYRLSFGENLFSSPAVQDITGTFSGSESFQDIRVQYDGGVYTGFILTTQGVLYRLDFGATLTEVPVKTNLTNFGVLSGVFFFDFLKHNSKWHFYTGNFSTRFFYRVDFPDNCSASTTSYSGQIPPALTYSASGNYKITLTGKASNGSLSYKTQVLSVQSLTAPSVTFTSEGMCEDHDVQFAISANHELASAFWTFGDGIQSELVDPVHTYETPGTYSLKLAVMDVNGCSNFVDREMKIFSEPQPYFALPDGITCTETEISLVNYTEDSYEGNLSYKWVIDEEVVATSRELAYEFTGTGNHPITLEAAIPGCSKSITKTLLDVRSGPHTDFVYGGHCDNEIFQFLNNSSGNISTFKWYIDNILVEEAEEISTWFTAGPHEVTLEAYGTNGCVSVAAKSVFVSASPVANFFIASPVIYCQGTPIQFNDASTSISPIEKWEWKLENNLSSDRHPTYIFLNPSSPEVILKVTNADGCSSSVNQTLNILKTPDASFNFSPLCVASPVTFTSSGSSISKWDWQIGDKKYTSSNPTHTFRTAGEYEVMLTATGTNGCSKTSSFNALIYPEVDPVFSVLRNCTDQLTVFTDETESEDQLVYWKWEVNGKDYESDDIEITFDESGIYPVEFTVRTASGCTYKSDENIQIAESPEAIFKMSSEIGSPDSPFEFTNFSTGATLSQWQFSDGYETNDSSPSHAFATIGDYKVNLTVSNDEGCEAASSKTVRISVPAPDVQILSINAVENPDKSLQLLLILENNGNTVFENLKVAIDVSGTLILTETLPDRIFPQSRYNFTLNYGIQKNEALEFICAQAILDGDVRQSDNKNCISIESEKPQVLPVYPNPAKDIVSVEWMSSSEATTEVHIINSMGIKIFGQQFETSKGLNRKVIRLPEVEQGIYMIVIQSGSFSSTQRVVLTH
jgi:PKD repeat protein